MYRVRPNNMCKITYETIPYEKIRTKYGIKLFQFRLGLRENEVRKFKREIC